MAVCRVSALEAAPEKMGEVKQIRGRKNIFQDIRSPKKSVPSYGSTEINICMIFLFSHAELGEDRA